jgi:hypothetical protein
LSYRGHCLFLALHSRPSGPPYGRPSVVISAGPKRGVRLKEYAAHRNDERRPTALTETRSLRVSPRGARCRPSSHRRLSWDLQGTLFFSRFPYIGEVPGWQTLRKLSKPAGNETFSRSLVPVFQPRPSGAPFGGLRRRPTSAAEVLAVDCPVKKVAPGFSVGEGDLGICKQCQALAPYPETCHHFADNLTGKELKPGTEARKILGA